MAIDPICGMEVDPQTAEYKSEYKGKTYYFCSLDCKRQFDQEPEMHLNPDFKRGSAMG
jgi:YHS domain-containing protein